MKIKKFLLLVVALLITIVGVGCDGDQQSDLQGGVKPEKAVVVEFWMYGDDVEMEVYKQLVSEFNKANEGYVTIRLQQKSPDSYSNALTMVLNGKKGPDLFYVGETGFKAMAEAGYLYDISSYVENSTEYDISKMWESAVSRFQYDVTTKTNDGPNKKYYAVPKDIGPTVIFYNETLFKGSGVNVISVAAKDLAAFNGGAKDSRGKTKAEYGIQCEVKEKGYFIDTNGQKWFNNQVALNWEETVALSKVIQGVYPATKGFYTEWWFNYGWSVGGDVIQYIPSNDPTYAGGYWDFTLMDPTPNYIVDDNAEPFSINGNTYQPGEVISYQDKLVNEAPAVAGQKDESVKNIEPAVLAAVASGQLEELPSQREAFVEFVRLAATTGTHVDTDANGNKIYGHEVTPYPNSIGGDSGKTAAFATGKVAMLVDGRWNVTNFREQMDGKYEWDVAPLPMYKEYDAEGNVKVHGVPAGHSGSVGVAINAKTQVPNAAWKFLEYIGGEYGQSVQSKTGFAIPLQKHLALDDEIFLQSSQNPRNSIIFIEAAENQKAGDWWYLRDNEWINEWANLLNGSVRNGNKTLTDFYNSTEYNATYATLLKYTKK